MRRAAGAPAGAAGGDRKPLRRARAVPRRHHGQARGGAGELRGAPPVAAGRAPAQGPGDRKSTRLNSSHLVISYAVFCLKKKKKLTNPPVSASMTAPTPCTS